MDDKQQTCIFGPVPSRRLGRSLGIDVVPFKTCTYDCIYCQLGKTTRKTMQRREWVPLDSIIDQLKARLSSRPDVITLSGSGEPTLYARLQELIVKIKETTDIPVAVLTNGSLLWLPEVRNALTPADLVVPSLDAGCARTFHYVNRPHPDISFSQMLEGLVEFRQAYTGPYWLEVFLLAGVTTPGAEVNALRKHIQAIQPDKVQVNTIARPPAEGFAEPVPAEQLQHIAEALYEKAEVIVDNAHVHTQGDFVAQRADILALLRRRPCTVEDIATGLGLHHNEVIKYLHKLSSAGRIEARRQNRRIYYVAL